jgi:hypothetical protein
MNADSFPLSSSAFPFSASHSRLALYVTMASPGMAIAHAPASHRQRGAGVKAGPGNPGRERATAAKDNASAVFARLAERDEDSDLAALIRCGPSTPLCLVTDGKSRIA